MVLQDSFPEYSFFDSVLIIRVSTVTIIFLFLLSLSLPFLAIGVLLRHSTIMAEHTVMVERSCLLQYIFPSIYYCTRNWVSAFRICYYKPSRTALKIRFLKGIDHYHRGSTARMCIHSIELSV
jgi:hypothetical protein